jgi:hypothetical protein
MSIVPRKIGAYIYGVESNINPDNMFGLMTLLQNGKEYDDGLDKW